MRHRPAARLAALAVVAIAGLMPLGTPARAQAAPELLVEKKTFELPSFTTQSGRTLKGVKVGWESYGTLNAERSNAILICHFFSGTSHAAGRYAASDPAPGYWDAIVGPGKAIDTNKWFVLSSDTLVNLSPGDPKVVTTGPASIDPDTGKPYGMTFPIVTMRDFVEVQKALVESLGIRKLHAVAGASMGAAQTYEWAASHPGMVGRIMPVIGAAGSDGYLVAWLDVWATPIRVDPKWNGGDYYGKEPPLHGLAQSLKIVTLHANHWKWANATFGRAWAAEGKDPAASFDHRFKVEATLDAAGAARAKVADANHFLYLVKANQVSLVGGAPTIAEAMKKVRMPVLLVSAPDDLVFHPDAIAETAAAIDGVETATVGGRNGHLNGVVGMAPLADKVRAFMDK